MIPLENAFITNVYGYGQQDGKFHKGLDIISQSNDLQVKAIREGKVSFVGYDEDGFGNYVSIMQEDGYRVLYCHLERALVKKGEEISKGKVIGIEGTTGNSTGIHLHIEIRKTPYRTSDHINPADYLGILNQKGPILYVRTAEEEILKMLLEEYGEETVYAAFRNLCEREKKKDVVPAWAKEEWEEAVKKGISDGSRPQAYATRLETAIMVERGISSKFDK